MADDAAKGSSIEHLDTDNYGTWSFRMKNYLISKGLGGCIDGTATTAGSDKDQKALSHIALHVKDLQLLGAPIIKRPPWRLAPGLVDDPALLKLWELYLQQEATNH
jgi:hypothetical protein